MSAGTCPRCGGDGRLVGRHVRVGSYLMVCALCRGTGNVPPSGVGGSGARFRAWWHRLCLRLFYRPISGWFAGSGMPWMVWGSTSEPAGGADHSDHWVHGGWGHVGAGRCAGGDAMTTYWHGGRFPEGGVLTPQPMMRAGVEGDGFVYVTTSRDLAATYAATLSGSWLMQVEPIGPVEADPDSILTDTSFRCRSARVLRRYTLSNAERAARSAAILPLGWFS